MKKIRIGIVGCGGIANQKHLPSLRANSELNEVTAFCDILVDRAEKAAAEYGTADAKVYEDYQELMNDENVDVVHVCTSNIVHCPVTVAAFKAGKHVMCEKPMAHNSADAGEMLKAWKQSGKKFTIGYQNRFRDDTQMLHASCEGNELGDIYFAKAHALRRRAVPTWGVFPNRDLQGGGPLIDIGTHALDITLWMMNNYEPQSVTGQVFYKLGRQQDGPAGNVFGPWDPETFQVEDSAFGLVKMKNGATIYIEASWALNILKSLEASATLCGTKAGAEIHHGGSYPTDELIYNMAEHNQLVEKTISPAGVVDFFEGGVSAEGVREQKQWLEAILDDTEPLVRPEQAFVVTQILEAYINQQKPVRKYSFRKEEIRMAGRQIFNPNGFKNVKENGEIKGYEFQFKAQYYRGFTPSIIRDIKVAVDGETEERTDIRFTVNGETFTLDEIRTLVDSHYRWEFGDYAVITVLRDGGLTEGEHHIKALQRIAPSYMPFEIEAECEYDFKIQED